MNPMRKDFLIAIAAIVSLLLCGCHASKNQVRQQKGKKLVADFKKIYTAKDADGYLKLFYQTNDIAPPEQKWMFAMANSLEKGQLGSVSFELFGADTKEAEITRSLEYEQDGIKYHPDLEIIGQLNVVEYRENNPGQKNTTAYEVGETNGRLYFVSSVPVK